MIAYDTQALDALDTLETANGWHRSEQLTGAQWQAVQEQNVPKFYTPNLFIRIGLAIFTLILLISSIGLGWLVADTSSQEGMAILSFVFGLLTIAVLEKWAIKSARHFRSGVDDMMLYYGVGLMISSIWMLLPYDTPPLAYAAVMLPFLVVGSIRYLDRLLTIGSFACTLAIIFLIVKDIPGLALYLLPLSGMAFGAAVYVFSQSGQRREDARFWHGQLYVLEMLALMVFYASGNYWVVQSAGVALFELGEMPIPYFFWTFTFLVPLVFIGMGLRKKDRILLDIGLACVAAAIFSFRYYYSVLPLAWAGVLGGAFLFALSYFSTRYLGQHTGGSYTHEAEGDTTLLQEIEEQLIEQTIATQNPPESRKPEGFGGGQFGGGGAGGDF